jgi:hypothetical protein
MRGLDLQVLRLLGTGQGNDNHRRRSHPITHPRRCWRPQHEQIIAGIFQPLFVASFEASGSLHSIHYIPAHVLQSVPAVFQPRAPLRATARRAGWTGFIYNLSKLPPAGISGIYPSDG